MSQHQFNYSQSSTERTTPHPVGRPPKIDQIYRDRLRELATNSPKQFGYSFNQWTAYWLRRHLTQELEVTVSERHINRLLRQMGLSRRQRRNRSQNQPNYRHCIEISDLNQESCTSLER